MNKIITLLVICSVVLVVLLCMKHTYENLNFECIERERDNIKYESCVESVDGEYKTLNECEEDCKDWHVVSLNVDYLYRDKYRRDYKHKHTKKV